MGISPCASVPVTPGIVTFDAAAFKVAYPAFAGLSDPVLTANFGMATLQMNNSCCSAVKDAPTRALLLNLLVAHISALLNGANGQPPQGIVGRVSQASEGAVSVSADYSSSVNDSEAYYIQTPWGAQYWQSTLPYRTARYIPPCDSDGAFPWDAWPQ